MSANLQRINIGSGTKNKFDVFANIALRHVFYSISEIKRIGRVLLEGGVQQYR